MYTYGSEKHAHLASMRATKHWTLMRIARDRRWPGTVRVITLSDGRTHISMNSARQ